MLILAERQRRSSAAYLYRVPSCGRVRVRGPRRASRVAKEGMDLLELQKRVTTNTLVAMRLARLLEGRLMGR